MKHTGDEKFWEEVEAGRWEPETFRILDRFCSAGSVFIDIGAWNGVCSIYAEQLGSKVYAIEPDPKALINLNKNIKLNNSQIKVSEVCISAKNKDIELKTEYKNGFGNSMSSILDRSAVYDSVIVKGMTLEHFIEHEEIQMKDVCLIKIDIEGGEIALLKQAKKFLKKHKPKIYLSLHPFWFPDLEQDLNDIADILFGIYKVSDTNGKEYLRHDFNDAVKLGVHSFFLEA